MGHPAPCTDVWNLIETKLDEEKIRVIMRQAAQAIKHCLAHKFFHNDIQSCNILINTTTFNIKLIDFNCGLKFTGKPYSKYPYRGTESYKPPEAK